MARPKKDKSSMKEYMPWVEKYRPRNIDDIAHQSHVVDTLRKSLKTANLPHLLFYGPAGTGKTSTILALARQLYGPNMMKQRVLELNASDERGINVVRHKIKSFAQYTVSSNKHNNSNDNNETIYPCPPYKIIILDEADSMTRDAQTALRRTMERYSNVTRFCLICNYVSRIIAPVASRCAKFRFKSLTNDSMSSKLKEIAEYESIKIPNETIIEIMEISKGDMRKSITLLQSASLMRPNNENITVEDVSTVSVRIPKPIIQIKIIQACKSNSFQNINDICNFIICEGYPVSLVLEELLNFVIQSKPNNSNDNSNNNNNSQQKELFSNLGKAKISLKIGIADKKLVDGASEFLQLLDVLSCVSQNINKN